jgi:hypothetical protein
VAWACALVALANGVAWSLILPPFQVPDENAHYAYVQQVAERGTLPRHAAVEGPFSPREDQMLGALLTYGIEGHRANPSPDTQVQQQVIDAIAKQKLSARGSGDALTATSNPPLYYALQAVPYKLAGGKVLDKLAAMRLLSALMGAVTVLLVFLFLRELLPGSRWAWPAGALVAAFQPMFGFMSSGVNNDDLLYLTAAGVLWALARAFRRGLTPANGALIGGFLGAGLISKLTLLGFVPAVAVGVALLLRRAWPVGGLLGGPVGQPVTAGGGAGRDDRRVATRGAGLTLDRRTALRGAGWALGLSLAPWVLYVILNHFVWARSAIPGGVGGVPAAAGRKFNFHEEVSHVWQLFLPRLWLRPQFGYFPLWETWFKGFVGRFGWLDYDFPAWVYRVALAVSALVVALAVAELARGREALRGRLDELAVYSLAVLGLCVEIGVESYRYLILGSGVFEQARYLLPLLCLYGAIVALAVRFGGRRWGPVLGVGIVVLAIGHDLFAQAITIARYYA